MAEQVGTAMTSLEKKRKRKKPEHLGSSNNLADTEHERKRPQTIVQEILYQKDFLEIERVKMHIEAAKLARKRMKNIKKKGDYVI
jgi:hypothetical protein